MEGKKISFGFMKTRKLEKPVVEEKRDYIECVEEKSIKVVGGETIEEITPLVIPLKPNTLITAERLKEIADKVERSLDEPEAENVKEILPEEKPPENETLDQMAVRELLQDAKKEVKVETAVLTVPVPAKLVMDGEKESTLDDYESVPIQDFGLAMLRGMGWTPNKEQSKYKQPQLRQKGLGLGADKVVKENQNKKSSKDKEEELTIVKNSFVKITTGKYSGCYGKVVSLDEDNGRVMVDIPVKKETVSLSEFMMHPVTKTEFDKESKVINADTYEQYKKTEKSERKSRISESPKLNEATTSQKSKGLSPDYKDRREAPTKDGTSSNGKNKERNQRRRRDSSSSEDRSRQRRKEKKKHSRRDSSNSPRSEKRRKHKNSRRRHSSSGSDESDSQKKERRRRSRTPEGKRDIDKKRKGKKKKRDRDRSPNYRKHRK